MDAQLTRRAKVIKDDDDDKLFAAVRQRERKAQELEREQAAAVSATKVQPAPVPSKKKAASAPVVVAAAPIVVSPPPQPGRPTVATNVLTAVKLEWGAAKKPPNSGPLTYTVECAVIFTADGEAPAEREWQEVYSGSKRDCSVPLDVLPLLSKCVARVRARNAGGSGPWAEADPFWRVQPCQRDGIGGYGPGKAFWWVQTLEEIDVYFPIKGDKIKGSAIHHEVYPGRIVLKRKDTGEVRLSKPTLPVTPPSHIAWWLRGL